LEPVITPVRFIDSRQDNSPCLLQDEPVLMMASKRKRKRRRRTAKEVNEYWRQQVCRILLEFGAAPLPELQDPGEKARKKLDYMYRLRHRYVVWRIRGLIAEDYVGRVLFEMVHDFLDQARLQTEAQYWLHLNREYFKRSVFML
jgi:hypothetical protein